MQPEFPPSQRKRARVVPEEVITIPDKPAFVLQTEHGNLPDWEVEGCDYIFEWPTFGPGWFVLRCDGDGSGEPYHFTSHPFEVAPGKTSSPAIEHVSRCSVCTNGNRFTEYTADEIIKRNGHRGM